MPTGSHFISGGTVNIAVLFNDEESGNMQRTLTVLTGFIIGKVGAGCRFIETF